MPELKEIIAILEAFAPPVYQESYDNSGLLMGDLDMEITSALLCLDIDEAVMDEAIENNSNLIISHHPLVFHGIKRLTKDNYINRILHKAIKNDVAIYCCHTNIDSVKNGVSYKIAERLGLKNVEILVQKEEGLSKLVVYSPAKFADIIRNEMIKFGGRIGDYEECSYISEGEGSFRGCKNTTPFIGEPNKFEVAKEIRIEVIVENWRVDKCLDSVKNIHPYQEVGYDIYPLKNKNMNVGLGVIGDLEQPCDTKELISTISMALECKVVRYSNIGKPISQRVAICGGSGSNFLKNAISQKADIYISADFGYHDFFIEPNTITIADVGHFEGEKYILELFYDIISKKMPNFVVRCTKSGNNPINYFIG